MGHIHSGEGQYDFAVSGFVVNTTGVEPKLMLHYHKKLETWIQPGGHVELKETPWAALTHELEEETGYLPEQLMVLQPAKTPAITEISNNIVHPIPLIVASHGFNKWDTHYHTDMSFGLTTKEQPAKQVAGGESTLFRWVTAEELKNLPTGEVLEGIREIGLKVLTHFVYEWYEVPFTNFSTQNPKPFQ